MNRRTDLALLAMRELSLHSDPLSGVVLAEAIGTTLSFLPQVMAPLIKGGWVASDRGPGGGYRLTKEAINADLLDVIEATEGPAEDGRCVMRDGPCPGNPSCPIHAVWLEARQVLMKGFQGIPAYLATEGSRR
ncbi:MAG TPA: Rrf2 family transcriptional regulator [Acidimicrobiia bacterium]|nr:Rrf2 family transcriptional regulator [Acidimicrobiia bacterium]